MDEIFKQSPQCSDPNGGGYLAPGSPEPQLVCENFYETVCNITEPGQEPGGTWCGKVQRTICAQDNCQLVEGEEEVKHVTNDQYCVKNSIVSAFFVSAPAIRINTQSNTFKKFS